MRRAKKYNEYMEEGGKKKLRWTRKRGKESEKWKKEKEE
jgi:hypothetical protein